MDFKARKLEPLTENESISSFSSWKQNLEFHLASCNDFAEFIGPSSVWSQQSVVNRGLVDGTGENAKTAVQKAFVLEHMIDCSISGDRSANSSRNMHA